MKKQSFWLFLWLILLAACSEEEQLTPDISLGLQGEELVVENEADAEQVISFTATHPWTAKVDAEWLEVSPESGNAGENTIVVRAKEKNVSGDNRTGQVVIAIEGLEKKVSVVQASADVLEVEKTSFRITADGKEIEIVFSTNLPFETLQLWATQGVEEWIEMVQPDADTRALQVGGIRMKVLPNTTQNARKAVFQIVSVDSENNPVMKSPEITVSQDGVPVKTSTDFSEDGKYWQIQQHKAGNGIPIVIMGDGFVDDDIASGYYKEVMEKAIEHFFTEEPVKSLRDYFDVWAVNVVSLNNAFGGNYSTALGCALEGGNSTGISGDDQTVVSYVAAVPEIAQDITKAEETTAIVILNTSAYAGTTYFGFGFRQERPISEFAIGFCPIIDGSLDGEVFRQVLCHECIGHGFGKLLDEYSYEWQGAMPDELKNDYLGLRQQLGWAANIDFTGEPSEVVWADMLADSRYQGVDAFGEQLATYEGACTYWTGAWRPTDESMMRSNIHGFNAPSRRALYKRLMKSALGDVWQFDYEDFVKFDQTHLPQPSTVTKAPVALSKPFASVRMANRMLDLKK